MYNQTRSRRHSEIAIDFDEEKVDRALAELNQCHLPGAAVGIAIGGKPVYRKGFGLASMELPVTLTPATRMRIYSGSKHFTCLAYMLLCEEGKARVDDPLGKYFPEFHPASRGVTMKQLMGNISGLRDAHGLSFQFCGTHWVAPSTEVMSLYRTIDNVDAPPATTWIYNNGAFTLLSLAIERISGQRFEDFLRQRIFEPVGMYDTLLRRRDTDFVPGSAAMHMKTPDGRFEKSYLGGDRGGTGGIVSTVNDMLRWLAHMDAPTVGTAETWMLMRTPQKLANGTSTEYGFALVLDTYRGAETIYAPGGGMGANAQMLKVPSVGLDLMVMVNREDVSSRELSLRILDTCLSGLEPVRSRAYSQILTGAFRSRATGRVARLFCQNGRQMFGVGGYSNIEVAFDDDGVLRPAMTAVLRYKCSVSLIGGQEESTGLRFNDYGNVEEFTRLDPVANPSVASIAGRYRSDALQFDATISESGLQTTGRFGSVQYGLECLGPDVWYAKALSSIGPFLHAGLCFEKGGFRFWSYCTRDVPFRRVD